MASFGLPDDIGPDEVLAEGSYADRPLPPPTPPVVEEVPARGPTTRSQSRGRDRRRGRARDEPPPPPPAPPAPPAPIAPNDECVHRLETSIEALWRYLPLFVVYRPEVRLVGRIVGARIDPTQKTKRPMLQLMLQYPAFVCYPNDATPYVHKTLSGASKQAFYDAEILGLLPNRVSEPPKGTATGPSGIHAFAYRDRSGERWHLLSTLFGDAVVRGDVVFDCAGADYEPPLPRDLVSVLGAEAMTLPVLGVHLPLHQTTQPTRKIVDLYIDGKCPPGLRMQDLVQRLGLSGALQQTLVALTATRGRRAAPANNARAAAPASRRRAAPATPIASAEAAPDDPEPPLRRRRVPPAEASPRLQPSHFDHVVGEVRTRGDRVTAPHRHSMPAPLVYLNDAVRAGQIIEAESRPCRGCGAMPVGCAQQNHWMGAARPGDRSYQRTLLPATDDQPRGFVCPLHPIEHAFCARCILATVLAGTLGGTASTEQFPVRCPGKVVVEERIGAPRLVWTHCDYTMPPWFVADVVMHGVSSEDLAAAVIDPRVPRRALAAIIQAHAAAAGPAPMDAAEAAESGPVRTPQPPRDDIPPETPGLTAGQRFLQDDAIGGTETLREDQRRARQAVLAKDWNVCEWICAAVDELRRLVCYRRLIEDANAARLPVAFWDCLHCSARQPPVVLRRSNETVPRRLKCTACSKVLCTGCGRDAEDPLVHPERSMCLRPYHVPWLVDCFFDEAFFLLRLWSRRNDLRPVDGLERVVGAVLATESAPRTMTVEMEGMLVAAMLTRRYVDGQSQMCPTCGMHVRIEPKSSDLGAAMIDEECPEDDDSEDRMRGIVFLRIGAGRGGGAAVTTSTVVYRHPRGCCPPWCYLCERILPTRREHVHNAESVPNGGSFLAAYARQGAPDADPAPVPESEIAHRATVGLGCDDSLGRLSTLGGEIASVPVLPLDPTAHYSEFVDRGNRSRLLGRTQPETCPPCFEQLHQIGLHDANRWPRDVAGSVAAWHDQKTYGLLAEVRLMAGPGQFAAGVLTTGDEEIALFCRRHNLCEVDVAPDRAPLPRTRPPPVDVPASPLSSPDVDRDRP